MTIEQARVEFIKSIAGLNVNYRDNSSVVIMESLIKNYNFVVTDEFLRTTIPRNMNVDMLIFFNNYADLSKYTVEISIMFSYSCLIPDSNFIDKITNLGFDILELCNMHKEFTSSPLYYAICNSKPNVLKTLLNLGIDFKTHELAALKFCIQCMHDDHLKMLVSYGADVTILKNIKINEFEEHESLTNIYNILEEYGIEPLITALMFSTIGNN